MKWGRKNNALRNLLHFSNTIEDSGIEIDIKMNEIERSKENVKGRKCKKKIDHKIDEKDKNQQMQIR